MELRNLYFRNVAITTVKLASWSINSPTHLPSLPIDVIERLKETPEKKKKIVRLGNVEALSRNLCCRGKAINSKYSDCVSAFFS